MMILSTSNTNYRKKPDDSLVPDGHWHKKDAAGKNALAVYLSYALSLLEKKARFISCDRCSKTDFYFRKPALEAYLNLRGETLITQS